MLLGGVPGTRRGRVVILGGGVVGRNAATIAIGMGAQVTVLDVRAETMGYLEDVFGGAIETLYSNPYNIEETVRARRPRRRRGAGPGRRAPKLVDEELIAAMEKGSVVVDVAVDQGGCIETCRPTDHDHPTYEVHGVVHYCVPNMPGAVAQTSTWALTNITIAYAQKIADLGLARAVVDDPRAREGRQHLRRPRHLLAGRARAQAALQPAVGAAQADLTARAAQGAQPLRGARQRRGTARERQTGRTGRRRRRTWCVDGRGRGIARRHAHGAHVVARAGCRRRCSRPLVPQLGGPWSGHVCVGSASPAPHVRGTYPRTAGDRAALAGTGRRRRRSRRLRCSGRSRIHASRPQVAPQAPSARRSVPALQ